MEDERERKAVIFDLDGTLLDTYPGMFLSANKALLSLGMKTADPVEFRKFIGPPLRTSFRVGCGMTDEKVIEEICPIYLKIYHDEGYKHADVYPGLVSLLEELKKMDVFLGVATMKREPNAVRLLQYQKLDVFFDGILGSDEGYTRTKSSNILALLELGGVNVSRAVMIGDTEGDENAAIKAGVGFIRVNYGYGFTSETQDSFSVSELLNVISERLNLN
ncbi:MAG: HAD family hydrolase [Spirochaetales bacterium]|nr:HAD family hydrolase [Spirochaetales bacterium]